MSDRAGWGWAVFSAVLAAPMLGAALTLSHTDGPAPGLDAQELAWTPPQTAELDLPELRVPDSEVELTRELARILEDAEAAPRAMDVTTSDVRARLELLTRVARQLEVEEIPARSRTYRPRQARAAWTPSPNAVASELKRQETRTQAARERVEAQLAQSAQRPEALAELVRYAYAQGAPELADELHASNTMLCSFNDAPIALEVTSTFRRRPSGGGDLELDVTRTEGFDRPLVVTFPPGTYGEGLSRASGARSSGRVFPKAQDLAFLRAPVVVFQPGQAQQLVMVPVACASYGVDSPKADHPYSLTRFAEDSLPEKLMVALCAGELKSDSEAQLAVWIARNDLDRGHFLSRGRSLRTFHEHRAIGPEHMRGAARLLMQGGIDPHQTRFFPRPAEPRAQPETPKVKLRAPTPTPNDQQVPAPGTRPAPAVPSPAPVTS